MKQPRANRLLSDILPFGTGIMSGVAVAYLWIDGLASRVTGIPDLSGGAAFAGLFAGLFAVAWALARSLEADP